MIKRYDTAGRDVTDLHGLHDEADIEVCSTNYGHPSITSGLHTNGHASVWVRMPDASDERREWIRSREMSLNSTLSAFVTLGFTWFQIVDAEASE
jgi:hypothetical protein